jgi:hypothetical protein
LVDFFASLVAFKKLSGTLHSTGCTSSSDEDVVGEVGGSGTVPGTHPDGVLGLGVQAGDDGLGSIL